MENKNFLEETLEDIKDIGKTDEDVAWVGSVDGDYAVSFSEFKNMASFEYNADLNGDEILPTLVVVFQDGSWFERNEFDGSSWWEYKKTPEKNENSIAFKISNDKHVLEPMEDIPQAVI